MTDEKQHPPADGKAAATSGGIRSHLIDSVTVRLEAFLGASRMSVGELSALREGSIVPLDAPLNQAVELRLNGIAVAKGELVSVGEKFAVRLIQISQ
ncbi:MAG: FliM/FliN family flagellar motor C-terminal domain-containing protein [Pseudomonadota bacterium]|nr:FliM/FliN family flagellar motor C-terminal domain-containing protein [Pseudomonadota bacterium]